VVFGKTGTGAIDLSAVAGGTGGFVINGTSNIWAPASSYIGGTSTTSPSDEGDDLRLNGSFTGTSTITFASAVTDPLIAIWSLGQPGLAASFTFDATPTLQVGGPNSSFGGASIAVLGNVVSGSEGNGVVQFDGTFTSISFTSTFENFYAFTVGMNGNPQEIPEPASLLLAGLGLGALAALRLRKRHV
jgi:hypothetical protein